MTRKAVVTVDGESGRILSLEMLADGDAVDLEAGGRFLLELADDEAIERAHSGDWGVDVKTGALVELPFLAMVLDELGVYVDKVELASSAELDERHVDLRPLGGDCDQPFGRYRWDADARTLVALPKSQQRPLGGGPDLERAFYDYLTALAGGELPRSTREWIAAYAASIDQKKKGG